MKDLTAELQKAFEETGLDKTLEPSEKEAVKKILMDARKKYARGEFSGTVEQLPTNDKD